MRSTETVRTPLTHHFVDVVQDLPVVVEVEVARDLLKDDGGKLVKILGVSLLKRSQLMKRYIREFADDRPVRVDDWSWDGLTLTVEDVVGAEDCEHE